MKRDREAILAAFSRRDALRVLLGSGAALAFGCGSSGKRSDGGAGADLGATSDLSATSSCAATPEGEIGPYFADDSASAFNRSNLLANLDGSNVQTGIALALTVTVLDSQKSCAPYSNAQVDIWHCNAAGVYSDIAGENTASEQWLRGYQLTDADGKVSFMTVIPGWYAGRTTHIHLRIRSSYSDASSTSDGTNTTQLFFDQTLVDTLATSVSPYSAEGKNPTTNAGDHVYSDETKGANQLALVGSNASGYTAAITIYLPITGDSSGGGSGPGGMPDGGRFGGMPPDGGMPGGPMQ
jgi:protocatechuate 3,4-dioxygenase beta subunit